MSATRPGGVAGSPSTLSIKASPTSFTKKKLKKARGLVTVSGRLSGAMGGEQVVISTRSLSGTRTLCALSGFSSRLSIVVRRMHEAVLRVTVSLAMRKGASCRRGGVAMIALATALGLSACGAAASDPPPAAKPAQSSPPASHPLPPPASHPLPPSTTAQVATHGCPSPAAAARARAVLRGAKQRFQIESRGTAIRADLRYIAHDRVLLDALRSNDMAGVRAEVGRLQHSQIVKHVTRIRVLRGSQVLVDGWPTSFDVAGSERELRDHNGRSLGRVQITIQDIIGFIKLEHRHDGTEVVARGAQGQVRTLLPAARGVSLPATGCVRVGGRHYMVRSFKETGFIGEPLTIWLLTPA
jgi:hypothetical protein